MLKILSLILLMFNSIVLLSQQEIKGRVKSLVRAKPIVNAEVKVLNSGDAVKTDSLGNFQIKANKGDSLIITNAEYYSSKKLISNDETIIVTLEPLFPIFLIVDTPMEFPGGLSKFNKYLADNLHRLKKKEKPERIFVRFAVDTTGLIIPGETEIHRASNKKLDDHINKTYDKEIIRIVNNSPAWIPARQRGKKVKQEMTLPITF